MHEGTAGAISVVERDDHVKINYACVACLITAMPITALSRLTSCNNSPSLTTSISMWEVWRPLVMRTRPLADTNAFFPTGLPMINANAGPPPLCCCHKTHKITSPCHHSSITSIKMSYQYSLKVSRLCKSRGLSTHHASLFSLPSQERLLLTALPCYSWTGRFVWFEHHFEYSSSSWQA
jgi:hypothetical protein